MIDLRSDTVTKPSAAMREAMTGALVGDDVYGEDPSVNQLQEQAASLLGKEAALFVPSGLMANQLCIRALTRSGDEIIVEKDAHIVRYESGAAAGLNGIQLCCLPGEHGILDPRDVEAAIRPADIHSPPTMLICLEQTHNSGGGAIYPLATIEAIASIGRAHGIALHLDGARLFNAVVETGVSAREYARHFDTVSFCLSKGLGAPVGSLIVSDVRTIERLRRYRRMYGGAMRQAGILAAAGTYALAHHIDRLQEDHENARRLAGLLKGIPSVSIDPNRVATNIVIFEATVQDRPPARLTADLKQEGVLINHLDGGTFRAVTHMDVGRKDIDEAGTIFARVLG